MDPEDTRTVNVAQRLRPIRLAFLIERESRRQALDAIRMCCRLWGGAPSPIIPVYRQTPRWSRKKRVNVTKGWIDVFEPDAIVEAAPGLATNTGYQDRLIFSPAEMEAEYSPKFAATTVWRAYVSAYEEVHRFVQRHPDDSVLCDPATPADALWVAAYFGLLPPDEPLRQGYAEMFGPRHVQVSEHTFTSLLFREYVETPLTATLWGLTITREMDWRGIYYLFNPASLIDVLHMWNLRAYGLMLYPLPLPYLETFRTGLKRATQDGYEQDVSYPTPMVVSPGPSISPADHRRAVAALADETSEHAMLNPVAGAPIALWDPDEMRERKLKRVELSAGESEGEATMEHRRLTVSSPRPSFRGTPTVTKPSAWATVVTITDQMRRSELAELYPPGLRDVSDLLSPLGPRDPVTATTEGLVARGDEYRTRHWWAIPTGTELFIYWLKTRGVEAKVSGAGKTTEEFIRALGGPHTAMWVGTPEIVRLIGKAANAPGGGVIRFSHLREVLGRLYEGNKRRMDGHVQALTNRGVVQAVLSASCPWCGQLNWYPPADLASQLQCRRCTREFSFPISPPPSERDWGYRPIGPFATPDFAHGAYSVALAIRFFSFFGYMTDRQSWTTSLEGQQDGQAFEIDFGIWRASGIDDSTPPALIFGEAKTFRQFEAVDFQRAERLLRDFPEATVTFATLQPTLTDKERAAFSKLAAKGKGAYRGRIIVLTATELSERDALSLSHTWQEAGGDAAKLAEKYPHLNSLRELSNATLELHAGWTWPPIRPFSEHV